MFSHNQYTCNSLPKYQREDKIPLKFEELTFKTCSCHEITFNLYVQLFIYLQQCSDLLLQGTDNISIFIEHWSIIASEGILEVEKFLIILLSWK